VFFDRQNQLGVITLRNALGGRVRTTGVAALVLQALESSK
jgi:hypothetical protein